MALPLVCTAVFGGYDQALPQVEQDTEALWLCYTDDPHLVVPPPWRRVVLYGSHPAMAHAHPRLRTIVMKAAAPGGTWSVWLDANVEVFNPAFLREAIAASPSGFGTYAHPTRWCIYEEAEASLQLAPEKWGDEPLLEQVASYREAGHPEQGGLYAVGVLVRDGRLPVIHQIGRRWLEECIRWSGQTQLSLPPVLAEFGVTPDVFTHCQIPCELCTPGADRGNPWLHIRQHARSGPPTA